MNFLRVLPLRSAIIALSSLMGSAVEIPVVFELDSDFSEIDVGISITQFGSESGVSRASGFVNAVIDFVPDSGELKELEFTGGEITFSPILLEYGSFAASIKIEMNQLKGFQTTVDGPEVLDNAQGLLTQSRHPLELTSGSIAVEGRSFGSLIQRSVIDVTEEQLNPEVDPDQIAIVETLQVSFEKLSETSLETSWRATYNISGDANDTQTQDGFSVTLNSELRIRATATFTIPTAYGEWLTRNELETTTKQEAISPLGLHYGLLYAFDLTPETQNLPIQAMTGESGNQILRVVCPEGGLQRPLEVVAADDLDPQSLRTVLGMLEVGESGVCEFQFPAGPKGFAFLRIPEEPALD